MKWLEGWFGTMSGGLGAVIVGLVALLTPAYSQAQSCVTSNGVTTCYSAYGPDASSAPMAPVTPISTVAPGPQPALWIPVIFTLLLFVGVLVGTWLDLGGRRTAGRLILIISVSLLFLAWLFDVPVLGAVAGPSAAVAPNASATLALILPLTLPAFVAGILACVRRDAPKPVVAAPAQRPVSE